METRMADAFDDRLDRYVAGELSAREQRELAQAALDDPALFDTLTAAALVGQSARGTAPTSAPQPLVRPKPRMVWLVAASAAIAAAAVAVIVVWRPSPNATPSPTQAAVDAPRPVASPARAPETPLPPPIFLTARADAADQSP